KLEAVVRWRRSDWAQATVGVEGLAEGLDLFGRPDRVEVLVDSVAVDLLIRRNDRGEAARSVAKAEGVGDTVAAIAKPTAKGRLGVDAHVDRGRHDRVFGDATRLELNAPAGEVTGDVGGEGFLDVDGRERA